MSAIYAKQFWQACLPLSALILLASCGVAGDNQLAASDSGDGRSGEAEPAGPAGLNLPLPEDRAASAATPALLDGADAEIVSPGAVADGAALRLSGAGLEYAIYRFSAGGAPSSLELALDAGQTSAAYIGLADYSRESWQWSGPADAGLRLPVAAAANLSPQGNIYVAVVAGSGSAAKVDSLRLYRWLGADPSPDTLGEVGIDGCLAVVNGRPAMSYFDQTNWDLKFVRALDAQGSAWGEPQTLDSEGNVGRYSSLAIIGGRPAISYSDASNGDLKYIRAVDASGSAWGEPQSLVTEGSVGAFTSLAEVNGAAGISFFDETNANLMYIRGAAGIWGLAQTLDSAGQVGSATSLEVVGGRPAISYRDYGLGQLKYIRAQDANGGAWALPVVVDAAAGTAYQREDSLAEVNGRPAISYPSPGGLRYVRAADAAGGSWPEPQTLYVPAGDLWTTSLAVINGRPAIAFYAEWDLNYLEAADADGSAWGAPAIVDGSVDRGRYASLAEVDGAPAISYWDWDSSDLLYTRLY